MKIRLAVLVQDRNYLNRISSIFGAKYADKLEVYSFTDQTVAMDTLASSKVEVFLADEAFMIDTKALPKNCGFAYLVDNVGIESFRDQPAVCKFQKAELIYRQILSLYSEKSGSAVILAQNDGSCRIVAFASPSGGTGCSSMAAAYSINQAEKGRRTLYLNLEKYGVSESFFSSEGQFTLSDIIFTLKSRKANLSLKLESCVRHDESGVYYYASPAVALDMLELKGEEIIRLINEIKISGLFDLMVLDMDFGLDKDTISVLRQAQMVIMVGDGSEISNSKITRATAAMTILEQDATAPLNNRLGVLYNKFSNKTGSVVSNFDGKTLGGAPKYEHAKTSAVIRELSKLKAFDQIEI